MQTKSIEGKRLRVTDDISQLVGDTPILQLKKLVPDDAAGVYAKLEYLNPGGSVKDRAASGIILRAEADGQLRPGGTIVEATAGNTGIGLALIGVQRGYKVALFVPERFSEEKVAIMRALGAVVARTPDAEGMPGAIRQANEFTAATAGAFMAGQFDNPANPDYHYETTAPEIFEQMEGHIDALVIGAGTAGTFTGVARFLKERLPSVLAYAVETQGSILGGRRGRLRDGERTGGAGGRAVRFERRSQCCGCGARRGLAGTRKAGGHNDSGFCRTVSVEEDF